MSILRKLKAFLTLKRMILIIIAFLLVIAFSAKIPIKYDAVDYPQISLNTEIHHDYIDQELWNEVFNYRYVLPKGDISELDTDNLARVKEVTGETYNITMGYSNLTLLNYYGRGNIYHISRNIPRNDESVTVIYFYYSTTLVDRFNYFLPKFDSPVPNTVRLAERNAGNEHKMVEIYYLQADFRIVEEFSDESYYAQKDNGMLVWSGMI